MEWEDGLNEIIRSTLFVALFKCLIIFLVATKWNFITHSKTGNTSRNRNREVYFNAGKWIRCHIRIQLYYVSKYELVYCFETYGD